VIPPEWIPVKKGEGQKAEGGEGEKRGEVASWLSAVDGGGHPCWSGIPVEIRFGGILI